MRRACILTFLAWGIALAARSTPAAHPSTQLGVPRAPVEAQAPAPGGPQYAADEKLVRPLDYREWVYVTSGLGMTYGPAQSTSSAGNFDNVFVNRSSYTQFMNTGRWPDKTIFILEVRSAEDHVSINNGGRTQGALLALEAEVKDQARFPGGWAYFSFGGAPTLAATAAPLPATASCYSCHRANTAVEQTFVQFYPTLMEVARRMGTVRPDYDPARKP
jgi:hypothetical protein